MNRGTRKIDGQFAPLNLQLKFSVMKLKYLHLFSWYLLFCINDLLI